MGAGWTIDIRDLLSTICALADKYQMNRVWTNNRWTKDNDEMSGRQWWIINGHTMQQVDSKPSQQTNDRGQLMDK